MATVLIQNLTAATTPLTGAELIPLVQGGITKQTALTNALAQPYYAKTTAENTAGVTPTNYSYAPGFVERYGANTTPGTTDMTAAIQASFSQAIQSAGSPVRFATSNTYKSSQITVSAACEIYGPATINISGSDVSAYQWCKFTASFSGFIAEDLTIVGDNVEANSHYGFGPTSSAIVVSDAAFKNIVFRNGIVGIDASAMDGCFVSGGKIGPLVGTTSGRGYGIAGGTNSKNISVVGTHFYRCSRHSLYYGATIGGTVSGCIFEEHGYGATPSQLSALVLARMHGQTATGNTFINCVHNPAEITDSSSIAGTMQGAAFVGNTLRGCKKPIVVGDANATVDADNNTIGVSVVGNSWYMPAASDGECIRVYQADTLNISANTFYFPTETIGVTCITIDDVAANYPTNVLVSGNCAYVNTSSGTKALIYIDTGTCGSGSTAKIDVKGNSVFGGGNLIASAAAIQNANIKTDTLQERAITGATPYVCGYNRFTISQSGATNVTNFLGGYEGQRLSIKFVDGNSTIKNTNIYTAGAVDFVGTSNDQLVYEYGGSNWREISRSVN